MFEPEPHGHISLRTNADLHLLLPNTLWTHADLDVLLPQMVVTNTGLWQSSQSKQSQWYIMSNSGNMFLWTTADCHVEFRKGLLFFSERVCAHSLAPFCTASAMVGLPLSESCGKKQWKPFLTTGAVVAGGIAGGGVAAGWGGAGGIAAGGVAAANPPAQVLELVVAFIPPQTHPGSSSSSVAE